MRWVPDFVAVILMEKKLQQLVAGCRAFFSPRKSLKRDVEQHRKLLLSNFVEFRCIYVNVCGHAANLPFCAKVLVALGLDRKLL